MPLKFGSSALHLAARTGDSACCNLLVDAGSDINIQDRNGNPPLYEYLIQRLNPASEIVKFLIKKDSALLTLLNKEGKTPESIVETNMYITKKEKTVILNYFDKLVPAEIRARGKQAIKIYKEELKTGSMSVVNSRCMFLGKEGAGKTSCVKAMVGERFNSAEQSTDGIVTTTVFQAKKDCSQWKKIKDVNDIELSEQIRSHALGEKVDKRLQEEGNVGTWAKFKNAMYKMVRRKENVSDITSIWDYAGQLDYYITHRFFLTNTVSYCVAFNVMDNLDEPAKPRDSKIGQLGMTNLDMNFFWIRKHYFN
ncbi:uncharacterized protein [Antedon mediterranea]|uniref:uncharacterized protein n=1 Tax=Antedon mediterranea TaxID=105859 RepID=UPI003AF4D365